MLFNNFFVNIYFIFLFSIKFEIDGAKILGIIPGSSRSHYSIGRILFEALAERGHELTLISSFKSSTINDRITEIKIDGVEKVLEELGLVSFSNNTEPSSLELTTNLIYGSAAIADLTLKTQEVQNILRSHVKFDLLISDMHLTDSILGIANYYQIPSVSLCSAGTFKWTDEQVGNPYNPAYNPHKFLGYTDKMSLKERIMNSIHAIFDEISYRYLYLPSQEVIYKKYFSDLKPNNQEELPPLIDLIHNVSLVLINSHTSLHFSRAYVPNMIEVGGLHIKKNLNLSNDITRFLDESEDGIIYFSMGANLKSKDFPIEKREAFVKAFQSLTNYQILWKWENTTLQDQPYNVVIGPWFPQQDILAHPNVKLFITHGGLLSTMEAIYFAKPIIGIPVLYEQKLNVEHAMKNGYGRYLDYNNLTEESLKEAIYDVLNNPNYKINAERLSTLFRDNALEPIDKAVYYIEYVLRHNGAPHLRSAAIDLSIWKYLLIDVTLIILAGLLIIILVPSIIIGIILRKNNAMAVNLNNNYNNVTKKIFEKIKKSQ